MCVCVFRVRFATAISVFHVQGPKSAVQQLAGGLRPATTITNFKQLALSAILWSQKERGGEEMLWSLGQRACCELILNGAFFLKHPVANFSRQGTRVKMKFLNFFEHMSYLVLVVPCFFSISQIILDLEIRRPTERWPQDQHRLPRWECRGWLGMSESGR